MLAAIKTDGGLQARMKSFARVVTISLVVLMATALVSLQMLRIEGPLFHRIKLGQDLIADVLPPPEYVIEAYLETNLALRAPSELSTHEARLKSLEVDYRERQNYWSKAGLPAALRQALGTDADRPAQAFWDEVDTQFLPALKRGDTAAAEASYTRLSRAYATHREAIDRLVVLSNRMNDQTTRLAMISLAVFVSLVLLVGGGLVIVVQRQAARIAKDVINPLADMAGVMTRLSGGDLAVEIAHQGRGDEVGDMAKALAVFRTNAADAVQLRGQTEAARLREEDQQRRVSVEQTAVVDGLASALSALAGGELRARIGEDFPQAYDRLRQDFNAAAAQLDEALNVVRQNAHAIGARIEQIAGANDDLSRRTQEQAVSVEETGRTLMDIADAVRAAARATAQASEAVLEAKAEAQRSDAVIHNTVEAMNQIVASSQDVTQVVEVIDGIAFQTNLLALNAGVEAARAGDAGRGFAVVATEVRALAQHSAARAKEINALISTSTGQVDSGMAYVQETGEALRRIVLQVGDLATFVGRIAESTQEQAGRLGAVNVASGELEKTTQDNARMAEESAQSVQVLREQSRVLMDLVDRFQLSDAGAGHDAVAQPRHPAEPSADQGMHAHALIVDDHPANRAVAAAMCDLFGITYDQAVDGEGGLQAARSGRYDLILMDIMMPGIGGVEAIRGIRALSGNIGRTPIIAVTANALEEAVKSILAAGATSVIEKPLSPTSLKAAIGKVLGVRRESALAGPQRRRA